MKHRMRHIRQIVILTGASLLLAGCARSCEGCNRELQTSAREYEVQQYSGGTLIKTWRFRGILNNQDGSDGYYWYQGDTLIEISGDIVVRSW